MLLEHNKEVFKELEETLFQSGCCCVIMGTGVGKTYVASELLDKYDYRALVVSPRNSINEAWKKHSQRVETITYQKLANIFKEIDFSKYSVVICDEVHHVGAASWGKPIRYIIDNKIVPVIGLTEDPVRYSDGKRNVAEEFFDSNVAFGEDVPSAIEKGILNKVTYIEAMYNSDGLAKTLKGRIQKRLYAKLNLVINKTPTVNEILKNNMPSGKRKGIIFASTIEDIKFAMDFVHSVYPNAEIRYVHSKQSDSINEKNMDWFKKTDEGYICSVDMISEGVHIKGVNTLIMLRRTQSVNLFNQQLGRCLDASTKEPSIIFDLVNNQYSIRIIKNKLRIKVNSIFNSKKISAVESDQLIVKDFSKNLVEVLREIKESFENTWKEEEDNILYQWYQTDKEKCFKLIERTRTAIICRANKLGLSDIGWSDEEIEIMKKYYGKQGMSSKELKKLLPRHSEDAIVRKAGYLGLSGKDNWTEEELEILNKWYAVDREKCYQLIKKSKSAINRKAKRAGLNFYDNNAYSPEEEAIIAEYAKFGSKRILKELVKAGFRKRSLEAIRNKANKLGHVVLHPKQRKIRCVETGKVYDSCMAAERDTKISNTLINQAVRGKRKVAGGYHWEYAN